MTKEPLLEKKPVSIFSEISVTALPIALQMSVTIINSTGNAILFSRLSPHAEHSAAASIVFTVQSALSVTLCGFFYRLSSIVNDHQNKYATPQVIVSALALAGLIGIPTGLVTDFSIKSIFISLHTDKAVCDIIGEYYLFFPIGLVAYLMASACYQVSLLTLNKNERSDQGTSFFYSVIDILKNNINIKTSIINLLFNFISNYILIELVDINIVSPVKIMSINFSTANIMRLLCYLLDFKALDFSSIQLCHACISDIFNNGLGACVQLLSELGVYMLLPFLSIWLLGNSTENLRILNVITQYMLLSQAIALILGQTAMRLVKLKCSEGHYDEIMHYVNPILIFGVLCNLLGMTLGLIIPKILVHIFHGPNENNNTGFSQDFRAMLAIQFFLGTMDMCRNIIPFVFRPLKIYRISTQISVCSAVLGISLSMLLAKPVGLGIAGIVMGPAISQFIFGIISLIAWQKIISINTVKKLYEAQSNHFIDSLWSLPGLLFSSKLEDAEAEHLLENNHPKSGSF